MIRRPPRSTLDRSSAASDVYKRQEYYCKDNWISAHLFLRSTYLIRRCTHTSSREGTVKKQFFFMLLLIVCFSIHAFAQETPPTEPPPPPAHTCTGSAELSFVSTTGNTDTQTLGLGGSCLLYTSPSPRDRQKSRMPSSA